MTEIYYMEDDENIAMTVKEYLSQKGCSDLPVRAIGGRKTSFAMRFE